MAGDDQRVVIQIKGVEETDIYVMFNRAEGITASSETLGNQVTIVEQFDEDVKSKLLKSFSAGEVFRSSNWDGGTTGHDLIIEVCSIEYGEPDFSRVLTYVDSESNPSCTGTVAPTSSSKSPWVSLHWYRLLHQVTFRRAYHQCSLRRHCLLRQVRRSCPRWRLSCHQERQRCHRCSIHW